MRAAQRCAAARCTQTLRANNFRIDSDGLDEMRHMLGKNFIAGYDTVLVTLYLGFGCRRIVETVNYDLVGWPLISV